LILCAVLHNKEYPYELWKILAIITGSFTIIFSGIIFGVFKAKKPAEFLENTLNSLPKEN